RTGIKSAMIALARIAQIPARSKSRRFAQKSCRYVRRLCCVSTCSAIKGTSETPLSGVSGGTSRTGTRPVELNPDLLFSNQFGSHDGTKTERTFAAEIESRRKRPHFAQVRLESQERATAHTARTQKD